jgi:outer membrane receptor protein involved in Fe transport
MLPLDRFSPAVVVANVAHQRSLQTGRTRQRAPRDDVALYAERVFVGERALGGDFANDFAALDGYGVVNLAGQWNHAGWRVALRVNNLLDEEYSEVGAVGFDETFTPRGGYYPSPERAAWLTVSWAGP